MDYCHKQRQFIVTKIQVADHNENEYYTETSRHVRAYEKQSAVYSAFLIVRPKNCSHSFCHHF